MSSVAAVRVSRMTQTRRPDGYMWRWRAAITYSSLRVDDNSVPPNVPIPTMRFDGYSGNQDGFACLGANAGVGFAALPEQASDCGRDFFVYNGSASSLASAHQCDVSPSPRHPLASGDRF